MTTKYARFDAVIEQQKKNDDAAAAKHKAQKEQEDTYGREFIKLKDEILLPTAHGLQLHMKEVHQLTIEVTEEPNIDHVLNISLKKSAAFFKMIHRKGSEKLTISGTRIGTNVEVPLSDVSEEWFLTQLHKNLFT